LEICNAAIRSFNCKILVLWGPGDESDAEFIKRNLGDQCCLAPKSNLLQLGAFISKCNVIISNDSGPMHIAAAIGVPTIGLFGPTNPRGHRPYSVNSDFVINNKLDCICCDKLICPLQHECMTELDTSDVIVKIRSVLNK
jgi:ADP-heptose:LPS heptosyltransferase